MLRFIETAAVVSSIEANVRNTLMVSRLGGPHNLASCSKSTRRCAKSNAQKRLWSVVCHYFALKIDVFLTVSAALATVHHRKYWKNVRYSLTDKNELVVIGLGTITKLSTVTTCNVRLFHVQ